MKIIKQYINIMWAILLLISIGFVSCQNDFPESPETNPVKAGLTVTGTVQIPGMSEQMTRGTMGEVPGSGLKLSVLQFEASNKDAAADQWWLNEVIEAETLSVTNVGNNGIVTFKVTLKSTDQPTRLHLMISDNFIRTGQGSEATVLPALYVANNQEAYWGVKQFNDGLTQTTEENGEVKVELRPEVEAGLKNVPVVRNFARIRVTNSSASTFEYFGFGVVHMPNQGTIAPIDPNAENPFVPTLTAGDKMLSYDEIAKTYSGYTPGTAVFLNTETEARNWEYSGTTGQTNIRNRDVYIYEHPYESTRRTYLIIYGRYIPTNTYGYYKVDIGKQAENGTFDYYNIIRNIDYNVVIKSVSAPGTATAAEAIARAPFNNLMASTETAAMLNVSDGENMLIVNDTNHIFTADNQTAEILFRYIKDVTGNKTEANDGLPDPIGLVPGTVIKSVQKEEPFKDAAGSNWVRYTITCNNPTDRVQTQDFTIVDGNGLGRTVHLILRTPWQYAPLAPGVTAIVQNGTHNDYTTPTSDKISSAAQAHLTVFFNLPDGLPESMFPLEFQLESKNQGIENDKVGTLVVASGTSLFDSSKIAISYIKTVTYSEYLYKIDDNNNVDVNAPNARHTIRCRFLTITSGTDNDAEIMIHNPYFSPNASVKFTR